MGYDWGDKPFEGLEDTSEFSFLRVGKITKVNYDENVLGASTPSRLQELGTVEIEWLDWGGSAGAVPITYPSFSNPIIARNDENAAGSIGSSYGFLHMPSVDDIVLCGFRDEVTPIIIAYLPRNFQKQTTEAVVPTGTIPTTYWGKFRLLVPGEYSLKSKQQGEIYLDKKGSIRIIHKVQPTTSTVPVGTLVETTIGEVYTDDTYETRQVSAVTGENLIYRTTHTSENSDGEEVKTNIEIDVNGAVVIGNEDQYIISYAANAGIKLFNGVTTITLDGDNIKLYNGTRHVNISNQAIILQYANSIMQVRETSVSMSASGGGSVQIDNTSIKLNGTNLEVLP